MKLPEISKRALAHIAEQRALMPEPERSRWIPVIGEEGDVRPVGRSKGARLIRYPFLGWNEREQVPVAYIRDCDGISVGFSLDQTELQLHRNHVVDYVSGRLAWVEAGDVETAPSGQR
jgi:hypothetical protein